MSIKHFEGTGIIAFYSNGLCQGHLIKGNEAKFRLAGQLLKDYKDPHHNDCMDPEDVYKVLIMSNEPEDAGVELLLRRDRNDDASGFTSVDNEFTFTTNQFLSGKQALSLQQKYFKNNNIVQDQDQDIVICIGPVRFMMS